MDTSILLDAIGEIDERYIVSAQRRLDIEPAGDKAIPAGRRNGGFRRRAFVCVAAAVLLLLGSIATAMAVNEGFRQAVYTILHISEPEPSLPAESAPVPSEAVESPPGEELENDVNAEYISLTRPCFYDGGLLTFYRDESGRAADFYAIEGGKPVPVETRDAALSYTWRDEVYSIAFSWCVWNGELHAYGNGWETGRDAAWYVSPISGSTERVVVTVTSGRQLDTASHSFSYDIKTRELTELFDWDEVMALQIWDREFSPDMTKALLFGQGGAVWYCDIGAKKLVELQELTGWTVSGAYFVGSDTLCCFTAQGGGYSCRTVDLSTGERRDVFSELPSYGRGSELGVVYTGGRYGLYIGEARQTYVLDFVTGERSPVQGFAYPENIATVTLSRDGT